MSRGNWSFIHEWTIYEYLMARFDEKNLRLKRIFHKGKLSGRTRWIKVTQLESITNTGFPDIELIKLKGETVFRPAEVKFTSSLFNYHTSKNATQKYKKFKDQSGFLMVLHHDYLPKDLLEDFPDIEIFEIDQTDFISFCRENFVRLLNRQIKQHTESKVWIMYQGPNFNLGKDSVKPARKSKIWCPTENLTGFDLAIGDRVLFIKTKGASRIDVQNKYLKENIVNPKWRLTEIYISTVKSKIYSRNEYIQYKKLDPEDKLWTNDEKKNGATWRWGRVFEFSYVKTIKFEDLAMTELYQESGSTEFVKMSLEAFCYSKSRELSLEDYRNLLEVVSFINN
ncbi:MAG: hypothetical protein ABJG47_14165 [Ekhidna sp.]